MHLAVLERHSRVKVIMQMHGLKEVHYWIVNMLTSFTLFLLIYSTFYIFGRYVFDLSVFSATSPTIMVVLCSFSTL